MGGTPNGVPYGAGFKERLQETHICVPLSLEFVAFLRVNDSAPSVLAAGKTPPPQKVEARKQHGYIRALRFGFWVLIFR